LDRLGSFSHFAIIRLGMIIFSVEHKWIGHDKRNPNVHGLIKGQETTIS